MDIQKLPFYSYEPISVRLELLTFKRKLGYALGIFFILTSLYGSAIILYSPAYTQVFEMIVLTSSILAIGTIFTFSDNIRK
jgi:hypothetical protein